MDAPCAITGLHFNDYRAIDAANWSSIKLIDESPNTYRHHVDNHDDGDTASRKRLRAEHGYVLEPSTFDDNFIMWPKRRAGNEYKAFEAEHTDKTILTANDYGEVLAMGRAVCQDDTARDLLTAPGAQPEVTLVWEDELTKILCKARLDLWMPNGWGTSPRRAFADLKDFGSHVERHVNTLRRKQKTQGQMAHYHAGISAVFGEGPTDVYLICPNNKGPREVGVFLLSEEMMMVGYQLRNRCLERLAECRESGVWPQRYDSVQLLEPEDYEMATIDNVEEFDLDEGEDDEFPY